MQDLINAIDAMNSHWLYQVVVVLMTLAFPFLFVYGLDHMAPPGAHTVFFFKEKEHMKD